LIHFYKSLKMRRIKCANWIKESLAEVLGTMILLAFGTGCVAQSVLSRGADGGMLSINIGWGAGVILGIMASASISGAHLNPAVSLALATVGKFSWRKVPHYILSQYIGAFLGAAITLLTYNESIYAFNGDGPLQVQGVNGTAGIFVTFPRDNVSNLGGAVDQVVGTALLLFCVSSIGYSKNSRISEVLGPLLVGVTVLAIGISFGHNAGYAINPARDLGPRILLGMAGWGSDVFTARHGWFWIPVACCHFGGILGAAVHYFGVEILDSEKSKKTDDTPLEEKQLQC